MPKQILAIANYRVSSDEQLKSNSLARQEAACIRAADELGAKIVKSWSGSVSSKKGKNIDRDDLQEMLEESKRNPLIKYAIFDELDRFMRAILEIGYYLVLFQRQGVKVVFASQPNLKTDTAADTLMLMLEAFKAEGSNEERQRKSISGQTKALQEGRWTFVPKPGYMRGHERGIPEIHPARGPTLKKVLIDIATYRVTPTQGLIDLNNSDFMADGHSHYKMDKFRKIVTDPFYASILEIDKQVQVRNENGLHESLITKEQHYELLKVMDGKKKNQSGPRKNGSPKYAANNIVICDQCIDKGNGRVVGFDHTNGKSSKVYEKYRCRACGRYISRQELHLEIEEQFKKNPVTQEGLSDLVEALNIVWKRREGQAEQETNRIRHKIKSLNEAIDRQVDDLSDPGNASIKSRIQESIQKKEAEILDLEDQLEELKTEAENDKEQFLKFAFGFVSDMGAKFLEISHENRLRCKQVMFPAGFYWNEKNKVYTPEISPLITLVSKKKGAKAPEFSHMVRAMRL